MAAMMGIRHGRRFRMRFMPVMREFMTLLGAGPGVTVIELSDERLRVRMGWAFRTDIPVTSIRKVTRERNQYWGIGVHGWAGEWLVNGSPRGIVAVKIDPPARCRVLGIPLKLKLLGLSVEDPDEFIAAVPVQDPLRS